MSKARNLADFISSGAITATATEINTLDGITATTAELNYTDGVTSAIQTQIDNNKSSFTATASGAITAGNVTALNNDGTVSVAGSSTIAANYGEGFSSVNSVSSAYNPYGDENINSIFLEYTYNKPIVLYRDGSNHAYILAGTVESDETITWGTAYRFSDYNADGTVNHVVSDMDIMYEPNSDRILVAYAARDYGTTNTDNRLIELKSLSLSGTTFTETANQRVLDGANSNPILNRGCALAYNSAQNTCVICYGDGNFVSGSSYNNVDAKTFYITSNSITLYQAYGIAVTANNHNYRAGVMYDESSGNYVFCYHENATNRGYLKVGVPGGSSTTPTFSLQTAITMMTAYNLVSYTGSLNEVSSFVYDAPRSQIILQGKTGNDGFIQRYQISGSTISHNGNLSLWNDNSQTTWYSNQSSMSYNSDNDEYHLIWTTGNNSNELVYKTVSFSGSQLLLSSVVYIDTSSLDTPTALYSGYTCYDTVLNKHLTFIGDRDISNTSAYNLKYGYLQDPSTTYNLTQENFIGFAQNTVADTETVTIHSNGRTDANQSGLTPGQSYYAAKADGSLGTTPGSDAVFVGTALSATEIRIASDDNATKLFTTDAGVVSVDGTNAGFNILGNATSQAEFKAASYNETYAAVTSTSNATTVNCEAGNAFMHTLTENTTFTFSNPPASGTAYSMSIEIIQDASASGYTVTWPTSVDWPSATAPTLTATASAVDVFVFTTRDGGTTWYGFTAGQALG